MQKVALQVSVSDAASLLTSNIKELNQHIYTKAQQQQVYEHLKSNLRHDELILHVDYAENYENKQQDEVQSAYFGHTQFNIFTALQRRK